MMLNGCFYILHIEEPFDMKVFEKKGLQPLFRKRTRQKAYEYLSMYLKPLESTTMLINSKETLNAFLSEYQDFKIDPQGYDPENFAPIYRKEESTPIGWKYGQIGIWASNYIAWLKFLETDYDFVMLVEDDVFFRQGAIETFQDCYEDLPEDWEIFHFCVPQIKRRDNSYDESKEIGHKNVCLPYIDSSNACYIINRKGIKKLLEQVQEGIFLPLDWHWFKQPLFNIYSIKPNIDNKCDLRNLESTHWESQSFQILSFIS